MKRIDLGRLDKKDQTGFLWGILLLPIGLLLGVWMKYNRALLMLLPQCPVSTYLGIYCPGCGGTRSVLSLMDGEFVRAVWYHPFVPFTVILYFLYLADCTCIALGFDRAEEGVRNKLFRGKTVIYLELIIILVSFLVKNILRIFFGIEM